MLSCSSLVRLSMARLGRPVGAPSLGQRLEDPAVAFLDALAVGLDDDLRVERRLVEIGDNGKGEEVSGEGVRVEVHDVAADALLRRAPDVDLDEVRDGGAGGVARGAVGR